MLGPAAAWAQSNTGNSGSPTELEKVTVTGSAIPRTEKETAAPVEVITKQDIDRSGYTTTAEVVQNITSNNSGSVTASFYNVFAVGSAGVALRGLNVNRTLVLIDGRRAANYGLADDGLRDFVDLNSIPVNQIERIEVLKDGASSLYGADAIAGVVNIITKKTFKGVEAWGEIGTSQHGGGTQRRFTATLGGGDYARKGHNAFLGIEYERDDKILVSQRDFPYNTTDLKSIGGLDGRWGDPGSFTGSTYGSVTPGIITTPGDVTTGQANTGAVSQPLRPCGGGTQKLTDAAGNVYCAQNQAAFNVDQPEDERFGLFGKFSMKLSDSSEAYLSATYYQNKVVFNQPPAQIQNSVPLNTNTIALPATLTNGSLNPNDPFAAGGNAALINYAFGDIPGGTQTFNQNYRLVGGVKGTWEDWDYDSAVVINHASLKYSLYGIINGPQLLSDVASGAYSFINPGSNTQAVRNALSPALISNTQTDLNSVDFRVNRPLLELPGGSLGFATGAEYRWESQDNPSLNPNEEAQGLGQAFAHGSRNVQAIYTELDAPLLKSLEIDAGARYDHYSDFTGAGVRPKVGLKWKPIEQLALRGTWSEGFRSPSFSENGSSASTGFSTTTPPASYAAMHGNDAYTTVPYSLASTYVGNPQIKPEKAENITLGMVFQPIQEISGSADYYFIRIRDEIESPPLAGAAAAYYAGQPIPGGYTVTPDKPDPQFPKLPPRIAQISAGYVNAASVATDGFDVNLKGNWKLTHDIRWLSDLEYSEVLSYKVAQSGQGAVDYVGYDSPFILNTSPGISRNRIDWANTLIVGPAEVTATAHYQSGVTLYGLDFPGYGICLSSGANGGPFPPSCHENHFVYVDLTGIYHLTHSIDLTAAVENLFDYAPPFEPEAGAGTNFDPTFAETGIVGRFFRAGIRYRYQ